MQSQGGARGKDRKEIYEVPPINPARRRGLSDVSKQYLPNREMDKWFNEDR